jgi:hypothetical protein
LFVEYLEDRVTPATILGWDVNGLSNFGPSPLAATSADPGVTSVVGLTRGSGVTISGTAAGSAWGGNNWSQTTASAGDSANQFATFGFTVAPGQSVSLTSIDGWMRRSNTGPANVNWEYQINSAAFTQVTAQTGAITSTSGGGNQIPTVSLSGIPALQNLAPGTSVTIRITPYGATSGGGNWYVSDGAAGNDLVLTGSVASAGTATATALTGITPLAANPGDHVTFTGTVTANSGTATPTGAVEIRNGGGGGTLLASTTTIGGSGANGTFSIDSTTVPAGTWSNIQAFYVHSGAFQDSNSAAFGSTLTVSGAAPTVTSPTATSVTATSATLGGNVTSDGGSTITERGVVYALTSANADPVIGGSGVTKVTAGGTTGVFTVNVSGLTSSSGYSYKAYATSAAGTTYTSVATFSTPAASSSSNLRIVTYNIEADINGVTTPRPGLYEVLEGIGEEKVQGNYRPPDILVLQETTSNTTTVDPIVTNLNSYYNGLAVYARSPYQATQSGSNGSGNGPNALVYNTTALNLLASVGVGTPQGSGNGEYRQAVRYEFQPAGDSGSTGIIYVYTEHAKAGTTSSDFTSRNEEAQIVRNDEATLPANAQVIYTGDLNTTSSSDASYQTLTAATSPLGVAQGGGNDPINRPGS